MKYEIWLGTHYSHFDKGVAHFNDGRTVSLDSCIHTATYGNDSVLIDDVEHIDECRFSLRWYIKRDAIEFYCVTADTPDILFHNKSGESIRIDNFGVLENDKSMSIVFEKSKTE